MIGVSTRADGAKNRRILDKLILVGHSAMRNRSTIIIILLILFILVLLSLDRGGGRRQTWESAAGAGDSDTVKSVMLRQPMTSTTTCLPEESRGLGILKRDQLMSKSAAEKTIGRIVPIEYSTVLVIMTHERVDHLKRTLENVVKARKVEKFQIIVSMDSPRTFGQIRETVASVLAQQGIEKKMNVRFYEADVPFATKFSGVAGCTRHVGSILRRVFETEIFEYLILLEDDLLVSEDFFEYFTKLGPLLHPKHPASEGLYCVSAWNDHAFGNVLLDESKVMRTNWYPGLGVMFHKSVWLDQWREEWPFWDAPDWNHDQWIRYESSTRERDCIAPQVPRTHHLSSEGLHVDKFAQLRYDKMILSSGKNGITDQSIATASDALKTREEYLTLMKDPATITVRSVHEILKMDVNSIGTVRKRVVVVLNDVKDDNGISQTYTDDPPMSRELFSKLGIFPFYTRMFFRGLLIVETRATTVFIVLDSMKDYWN